MKEFNKNSIGGVINEYGEPADLRNKQGRRHLLKSILALMLIGYLCGKTSYRSICYLFRPDLAIKDGMKKKSSKPRVAEVDKDNTWYKDKEKAIKEAEEKAQKIYNTLNKFIYLPNGVPHFSTFSRVLANVDLNMLSDIMYEYFVRLLPVEGEMELSIDGKALNGATNKSLTGKSLYIINVFSVSGKLFITSFPVGNKTNEEKALLEQLTNILLGNKSIVTTDAMGTKKDILKKIMALGSTFLLPLKANNAKIENDLRRKGIELGCCNPEYPHITDVESHTNGEVAGVILKTKCTVVEEDNEKPLTDKESNRSSIAGHVFFEKLYDYWDVSAYTDGSSNDASKADKPIISVDEKLKEGTIYLVKIGEFLVPMYYLHGRLERREVEFFSLADYFNDNPIGKGFEMSTDCVMVTRYRAEKVRRNRETYWDVTVSRTPYLSSVEDIDEKKAMKISLGHWAVEQAHNTLDTHFFEDNCTTRTKNAPVVLSVLRKCAMNIVSLVALGWTENHPDNDDYTTNVRKVYKLLDNDIEKAIEYLNKPFLWGETNPLRKD